MLGRPIHFEGLDPFKFYFYKVLGFRAPKKGEYYLSGSIVQAYKAPNDLPEKNHYYVVQPTHVAVFKKMFVKGDTV